MRRRHASSRRDGPVAPERQVVVKLKTTGPVRGVLRSAAAEDRRPARPGPLVRWIESERVLAVEPVFGASVSRSVSALRRIAVAAEAEPEPTLSGINVLTMPSAKMASRARAEIARDPLVEYAYVPPERRAFRATQRRTAASDPMVNRQWGLRAIEIFQAERTAGFPSAREVKIAVIDSGADEQHPDLQGVFSEVVDFTGTSKRDRDGHGTHVCGIIAATRNNSLGVRGVCETRRLMSLKALGPYVPAGYYRAIDHATRAGARVINLSLGGEDEDPTETNLIRLALRAGIVVVVAMGNEKQDGNRPSYPARLPGVIAVGATDEADRIAEFSNTGRHIALVAPGVSILSTVPSTATSRARGTAYDVMDGTSMAAPHVSAAAALLLAKRPQATPSQVRQALRKGADRVPGQRSDNDTYGAGRLNVREALREI